MQQTARSAALPAPPDPAGLEDLCARHATLCEDAGRNALGDDGWGEMADNVAEIAGRARLLDLAWTLRAAELAAARAEGFETGRVSAAAGRHRRGQGQFWPRAVPAVIPAAALGTLHHGTRTKLLAAAAALGAVTAAGTAGFVTLPDVTAHAAHRHPAAVASLAPVSAIRIQPGPAPSYQSRHGRTDAAGSRLIARPAASAPPPSSPPPSSAAPAQGTLDVTQESITPGRDGTARIDLTAVGGDVSWSAAVPAGVTLSSHGGTLGAGQVLEVTLTAAPGTEPGVITLTDLGEAPVTVALEAAAPAVAAGQHQGPRLKPGRHRRR
jgi:hypothetical protein